MSISAEQVNQPDMQVGLLLGFVDFSIRTGRCLLGMMLESLNMVADARYGFTAVNERWPVSQENIQGVVNTSWE